MFCCLFKKVTVHNTAKLSRIACNSENNHLAIGGSEGFVKVVQIELTKKNPEGANVNPLTFTQNLVCHKKRLIVLCWNSTNDKLTTSDEEGVIIVWKLSEKALWETEMINNREISFVTDLKWSKQGEFLCFIYDDGHAIVGTVEGSRCWGNDIKDKLYKLEWSPDESQILFACENSNIIVFSSSGYQTGEMEIEPMLKAVKIANISWWTNRFSENRSATLDKHLMVAFSNGIIQLYNDNTDTKPLKIVTEFNTIINAEWNPTGEIIAVSGFNLDAGERKDAIFFYSSEGALVKILRIPNTAITSFCWDSVGTKLAITTESIILFALVKQKYKWTYFEDTLVYSFMQETEHHSMIFWDTKKNTKITKYVKNLVDVVSSGTYCLISAQINENEFILILSNSIGSPVDNRIINFKPTFITMNLSHVIVANKNYVYLWQFRNYAESTVNALQQSTNSSGVNSGVPPSLTLISNSFINMTRVDLLKKRMMKETAFFIEDTPNINDIYNLDKFQANRVTSDPITSIFMNDSFLIIACESGKVLRFTLPHISSPEQIVCGVKLIKVGCSLNCAYLWGIDENNLFLIWDIQNSKVTGKRIKPNKLEFEKKDVWDVLWSADDPFKFALLEKNRLNVIKDLEVEEILTCNGYLAECGKLEITAVMLEELMIKPWENKLPPAEVVVKFETRVLRDLREMMNNNIDPIEIFQYIERNSNRKLWEMFAKYALLNLDFTSAEKAMLQYNDFLGLSFIKRLKSIDDDNLKKAEIHQFFLEYDQAEELYIQSDRKDLIIAMRIKLGHWERVIQLIKESGYIQEDNMKMAYNNLAMQLIENKEYDKAEELLTTTNNYEALIDLFFKKEEYEKAAKYIDMIPENSEFLLYLGEKFENFGLCEEAVNCYLKYGDPKKAIDTCVLMNKWNLAVELAEKNNFFQIEGLVNKYCNILIEKNKKMDLVELYRKSHKHTEAARVLIKIADDLKSLNTSPVIMKKIYVVAALEMESFKSRLIDAQISQVTGQTVGQTATLDTLITSDLSNVSDKALNNPWKGAEAYHFYMLCQNQLYQNNTHAALKTALRLVQYEKELDAKEVYRLIALSSFLNKSFKECSKALSKLENLPNLSKSEHDKYMELAVSIFTKYDPHNLKDNQLKCPGKNCDAMISEFDIDCKNCGSNFSACVLSGQSIFMKDYFKCKRCKHKSLKSEVQSRKVKFCGLCHVSIEMSNAVSSN